MSASEAATATATATASRRRPIVKTTLAFAAAIALGFGVASIAQHLIRPSTNTTDNFIAAASANALVTPDDSPAHPSLSPSSQVAAPRLDTAVVIGGSRFDNPEQLALPSDSVFTLSLQSDHGGRAEVYAINPEGQSSRLWSGHLQAGQPQHTPALRLQGMRGNETLRIVFKAEGTGGRQAATVVKELTILHV